MTDINNSIKKLKLINMKEVKEKTGMSTSFIYSLMSEGKFPKNVVISYKKSMWVESEIDDYICSLIQKRSSNETKNRINEI